MKKDNPFNIITHINGKPIMKKYTVYIEEKLIRGTEIEADTIEDAINKARDMYKNSEIVLDSNDMGTDAEIMAETRESGHDGEVVESTEWKDL